MLIQVLLLAVFVFILMRVLAGRGTYAVNAWKKIGIIILTMAMITSVLFPEITNIIANLLGIGRGADLLLYVFFAAFLTYVLMQYLKQQDSTDKINRLARRVAIDEAKSRYKI